jgi:hypothetical protein
MREIRPFTGEVWARESLTEAERWDRDAVLLRVLFGPHLERLRRPEPASDPPEDMEGAGPPPTENRPDHCEPKHHLNPTHLRKAGP